MNLVFDRKLVGQGVKSSASFRWVEVQSQSNIVSNGRTGQGVGKISCPCKAHVNTA